MSTASGPSLLAPPGDLSGAVLAGQGVGEEPRVVVQIVRKEAITHVTSVNIHNNYMWK